MRIDAHHHVWELGRYDYDFLTPAVAPMVENFGPSDLVPLLASRNLQHSVLVQTIASVPETRWFLQLAAEHDFLAGVVGWVDVTAPDVGDVLRELKASPKLVGIRHNVHNEPDDQWLARSDVRRGLAELARQNLPYDLLVRPQHLPASLALAEELPQLRLVVDHIAKPRIAEQGWDDWASPIAALAKHPQAYCKLSGMITEANWKSWRPGDLKPYIDHLLTHFGPKRLMFGSDWPVCVLAGTYQQVVDALAENLAGLSPSEQARIWGETAADFYRLKV
jgi:L-fuconolactonase